MSFEEIRARLTELPDRLRVAAKVAKNSGLMWELTLPGMKAAARALGGGAQNPAQVFRLHAANSPNKTALRWRDQSLTFAELDDKMDRLAIGLSRRGIGRGQMCLQFSAFGRCTSD